MLPTYFNPNGLAGKLLRGADGEFYFRPTNVHDAWDIADELDLPLHSCDGFENSIKVNLEECVSDDRV